MHYIWIIIIFMNILNIYTHVTDKFSLSTMGGRKRVNEP